MIFALHKMDCTCVSFFLSSVHSKLFDTTCHHSAVHAHSYTADGSERARVRVLVSCPRTRWDGHKQSQGLNPRSVG